MPLLLKNYVSTMFFIIVTYSFYNYFEYYQDFFSGNMWLMFIESFSFTMKQIFLWVITVYGVLLIPFYMVHKEKAKALLVIEYFTKKIKNFRYKPSQLETTALLAWGVKMFFAPLMIFWFLDHFLFVLNTSYVVSLENGNTSFVEFFNAHGFWIAFNMILFIDVVLFTLGYLVESPYLKNTIKSVEPTILGWVVAIGCYPPFNSYVTQMIGWYSEDFPKFENVYLHLTFNIMILILMWIYSWASVSLGWKASNLTNRWIVTKWPYRFIRHPAYVAKNLAWWIGALPMVILAVSNAEWKLLLYICLGTFGWSTIYALRAITEENHLKRESDYREYMKKVKWRFIPGVW